MTHQPKRNSRQPRRPDRAIEYGRWLLPTTLLSCSQPDTWRPAEATEGPVTIIAASSSAETSTSTSASTELSTRAPGSAPMPPALPTSPTSDTSNSERSDGTSLWTANEDEPTSSSIASTTLATTTVTHPSSEQTSQTAPTQPSNSTPGTNTRNDIPATNGERYPFPQNVTYPYGNRSTQVSSDHVKRWYESWSAKYLQTCNGNLRPGVDPLSKSLVEAQGFAMVAAAYMGDKPTLDRLYGYYETKLTTSACGLMGWDNSCEGFADQGAATDGDIDVASGLIVAHWQWPDDGYDEKARRVVANLDHLIASCGDTLAIYPGCAGGRPWGGCNETDASYYSPGFFRYFAEISGNDAWRKLADDTHKIRDAGANPSTGLVPDWQSVSGTAGAGSRKGYYSFDAIRTPYKHALDYLWHGNEAAKNWCIKLTSWAHDHVGVSKIVDGYQLDGSQAGQYHNMAAVGAMAVCSLANSQNIADAFVAESAKLRDDFWYSGYLGNLYLLAMSGNMWTPDMFTP